MMREVTEGLSTFYSYVRQTPIRQSRLHPSLFYKCENLQASGSFKFRGAVNYLVYHPKENNFVCASAGNHGKGMALACQLFKKTLVVFLPKSAHPDHIIYLKNRKAFVIQKGADWQESHRYAVDFASRYAFHYVHPFANPHVSQGQGTIFNEIMQVLPDTKRILASVGGGGLLHGLSQAEIELNQQVEIIGLEASGANRYSRSIRKGKAVRLNQTNTVAKSLAVRICNENYLDHFVLKHRPIYEISESEIIQAKKWMLQNEKLNLEYASVLGIAAILSKTIELNGNKTVLILCAKDYSKQKERKTQGAI